jgi:hypothetical protein
MAPPVAMISEQAALHPVGSAHGVGAGTGRLPRQSLQRRARARPDSCPRALPARRRRHDELRRLGRYPLLIIDEVGYIPFEPEAANLFFQLVSARYEPASLIVTSNKPFGRWGEVFGDDVVAPAMIDRLVHHAEVTNLKGDSYRLKNRDPRLLAPGRHHRGPCPHSSRWPVSVARAKQQSGDCPRMSTPWQAPWSTSS